MKQGWEARELEEISDFINGLWTGKKPPYLKVAVIRNTNFTKDNLLDYNNIAYLDVERKQFSTRKLRPGDIILEKSGGGPSQPVGRVVLFCKTEGDYSFSNFTSVIRIKDKDKVDPYYLHKFLHYLYITGVTEKMQNHTTGIRNLRFADYKKIIIPLPPLPEQQRIVAILDEAFAAIDLAKVNTQKNLQNATEVFSTHLNNVFANPGRDWKQNKLGDYFDITSSKRVFQSEWKDQGVPFYRAREIVKLSQNGFVNNDLFISDEMYKSYSEKYGIPKAGDLMVTGVGTLGICYVVRPEDKFYFKDGNIIWLKKTGEINSKFVGYAFKSDSLRKQIDNSIGVTVGTFTIEKAKSTLLNVPPLQVQRQIVENLDSLTAKTKKLEEVFKLKLTHLEELKRSILQKAFNGEL